MRVRSRAVRTGVRLAVDVGSVRIGVARCDPGGVLATPLTVVAAGRDAVARIADLAADEDAIEVIVGLPVSLSGRQGAAAEAARTFAARLASRVAPVPVRLVDERFTTATAHDALRSAGHRARARRSVVDKAAATVLLQAALDGERTTGAPAGPLVPARGLSATTAPYASAVPLGGTSARAPSAIPGAATPLADRRAIGGGQA